MTPIEITSSALADATAALADARRLATLADTTHATADAGLAAATEAHGALAGRIAAGSEVKPSEAAKASSAIADARAHVDLSAAAKQIAAETLAAREIDHAEAEFLHNRHAVAEGQIKRASACDILADAADAFSAALNAWSTAGRDLENLEHKHSSARYRVTGQRVENFGGVDVGRTALHKGAAALDQSILRALFANHATDSIDYRAVATQARAEAAR